MMEGISRCYIEWAVWLLVVATLSMQNFYWRVTSISFCCTRLYWAWLTCFSELSALQTSSKKSTENSTTDIATDASFQTQQVSQTNDLNLDLSHSLDSFSQESSLSPKPRRQSFSLRSAAKFLRRMVFAILLIWCFLLTPVHVFTPTFMDLWTPYSDPPPRKSVEVIYDPGEDAAIEYDENYTSSRSSLIITSVFAIHGLGSNPDSAWTYRGNGTETR